jgi:hypothetical protein
MTLATPTEVVILVLSPRFKQVIFPTECLDKEDSRRLAFTRSERLFHSRVKPHSAHSVIQLIVVREGYEYYKYNFGLKRMNGINFIVLIFIAHERTFTRQL